MKVFSKLFGRKTKRNINEPNEINKSIPIPHYAPNAGLTPREYMLSDKLIELESVFEAKCKAFLSKANPDEYNGSYMDAIIQTIEREAKDYIMVQRADHIRIIMLPLNDTHVGDGIKCESKLKQYEEELEKTKKELDIMKKVYHRGTIYEEIM